MGSDSHPDNDGPTDPEVEGTSGKAEAETAAATSGADRPDEIPPELQAEIRSFARGLLEMSYYEVLGVERDADAAAIRQAFFERSKRYHPDRYFSKQLGVYQELLTEIYKRVVVAHEVLRDSRLRDDYDKRLDASRPAAPAGPSLRSRGSLRSPKVALLRLTQQLESGRRKARQHFEEARLHEKRGDLDRAIKCLRLAMTFDARDQTYHDMLAELLPRLNSERADQLRRKVQILVERGEFETALPYAEEAVKLLPADAQLADHHALISLEVGDTEQALERAKSAISLEDENAEFRKTLGRIYKTMNEPGQAHKAYQRAWELDPLDPETKAELASPWALKYVGARK